MGDSWERHQIVDRMKSPDDETVAERLSKVKETMTRANKNSDSLAERAASKLQNFFGGKAVQVDDSIKKKGF